MADSAGKVWFVTGVGSGLGRALAETIVANGDIVIGTVRTSSDERAVAALGQNACAVRSDITDLGTIAARITEAVSEHGRIDVAVNNAGYALVGAIEEASPDEIRAQFEVNFIGAVNVIQCVLPEMRKRRAGHIMNITSVSGLAPWAGTGIYTASKYALEGLGQTLHDEVAEFGIKVTNIAPGGLRTDFSGRSLRTPARFIADYEGAGHLPQRIYREGKGKEPGSAQKAAKAIFELSRTPDPPLHLLLGQDALYYLEQKLTSLNEDVRRWKPVTLGIACDP